MLQLTPVAARDMDDLTGFLRVADLTLSGLDSPAVRLWVTQQLRFAPADREELARALAATHQVRLFTDTGQLHHEVAWSRHLRTSAPPADQQRPVAARRSRRMLGTG